MRAFRNVHLIHTATHLISVNKGAARLIWKRLPNIALYAVALLALFSVFQYGIGQAERAYYRRQPASHFINYTSFMVNNAREGEEVPYALCRDHAADYQTSGIRTIFQVTNSAAPLDQKGNKVFVYSTTFKGSVQGPSCAAFILHNADVHLSPGSYQMTLLVQFSVKFGISKQETVSSNVFVIRANGGDNGGDTQSQLNNLQQQLMNLQRSLDLLNVQFGVPTSAPKPGSTSSSTTTPNASGGTTTTNTTTNTTNNNPAPTSPTPTPAPVCKGITLPLVHTCVL